MRVLLKELSFIRFPGGRCLDSDGATCEDGVPGYEKN